MNSAILRPPAAYDISGFCRDHNIGRSTAFDLIKRGKLKARKAGKITLIAYEDAQAWLNSLPVREVSGAEAA